MVILYLSFYTVVIIVTLIALYHNYKDSRVMGNRIKRFNEISKRLDENKQMEMSPFPMEEIVPIYGQIIDDGNTVLTDEGELIILTNKKEDGNVS